MLWWCTGDRTAAEADWVGCVGE